VQIVLARIDSFRSPVVGGDCSGDLEALGFAAAYIKWENPGFYPKKRCIYIFFENKGRDFAIPHRLTSYHRRRFHHGYR
jgi:hypothetical protein